MKEGTQERMKRRKNLIMLLLPTLCHLNQEQEYRYPGVVVRTVNMIFCLIILLVIIPRVSFETLENL